MRNTLLISFICLILGFGSVHASQDIFVVQSLGVRPYEDALEGFKGACNGTIKKRILSEGQGPDILESIRRSRPDLILAIGLKALLLVKGIRDIPVVYMMVSNPLSILSGEKNITGVSMNISPEVQLAFYTKLMPDMKNIGILSDPEETGYFVEKAAQAAERAGINLIIRKVHQSKNVPLLLGGMSQAIDALWMLPDTTVVTSETVEFMFLFSIENRIPLLTFSEKFIDMGALASVNIDAFDLGRQAGEMAGKILFGADAGSIPASDARDAALTINLRTAKKLGIEMDKELIKTAKKVH
ncbi:MAG: ABC transporter substrate-binding protein [bacterium]